MLLNTFPLLFDTTTHRSDGTQDTVPYDGSHVVHEFHGGGPGIHASSDDVFDRCVVVGMQLRRPRSKVEVNEIKVDKM